MITSNYFALGPLAVSKVALDCSANFEAQSAANALIDIGRRIYEHRLAAFNIEAYLVRCTLVGRP